MLNERNQTKKKVYHVQIPLIKILKDAKWSDRADQLFPGHVEDRDGSGVLPGHVRGECYVHIHIIDCGYDLMSVYIYQNLPKCILSRYTAGICPLYLNKVVFKKKGIWPALQKLPPHPTMHSNH